MCFWTHRNGGAVQQNVRPRHDCGSFDQFPQLRQTDRRKDSKQMELTQRESRCVESQILPRNIAKLILKIIRHDTKGRQVKKETVQEIDSESVIGRAWGSARWFNPTAPTDSFNDIGLLGLIS
jgi:hypothetical protein